MSSRTVRYWLKLSETEFEPLATDRAGLAIECEARNLMWCKTCRATVELEGSLDVTGHERCPFCGERLEE